MDHYKIAFAKLFIAETKRRLLKEGVPRIEQCLSMLSEEQIWYRPSQESNSVGNLVLHLCGNVRQWIVAGLGNAEDNRERQKEFDEASIIPSDQLLKQLYEVMIEVEKVLDDITPEMLLEEKTVQGFQETGLSMLVHVVEHFSYHVGQITYFVKWITNQPTNYYGGLELDTTS